MNPQPEPETIELTLSIPSDRKHDFSEMLVGVGLSGFVEGSVDCDIPFEYGEDHLQRDYYAEQDQGSPFVFYGERRAELDEKLNLIQQSLSSWGLDDLNLSVAWAALRDADWKESWKQSFRPLRIGPDCVVLPPWEDPQQHPARHTIVIDPGMAFGTGQHETTQLCLRLFFEQDSFAFSKVFDVGSGSGILAIAAAMAGAGTILGCDLDPDSVRIAQENASANGCPHIQFTEERIATIKFEGCELIFANIQARPLAAILKDIVRCASPSCRFIFSGILKEEDIWFRDQMLSAGLVPSKVLEQGDWLGIEARFAS
jgi:ribosomal protein L11 methyltransferase